MPANLIAPTLVAAALVLLAGCAPTVSGPDVVAPDESVSAAPPTGGTEVDPDDPVTSAPPTGVTEVDPDDPVTSAPPTGGTDPEPDPGGDPVPSVSLPQLPVGGTGNFVDETTQNLQCAGVSWIVEQDGPGALREGIRIELTGAQVDSRYFELQSKGCQKKGKSCAGYTFTSDSQSPACFFPVRTKRPLTEFVENTSLTVAGTIRCVDVEPWECEAFVAAARDGSGSVSLSPPEPDSLESPDPESPDPHSPDPESPDPDSPDPDSPDPDSPDPDSPDADGPDSGEPDPGSGSSGEKSPPDQGTGAPTENSTGG